MGPKRPAPSTSPVSKAPKLNGVKRATLVATPKKKNVKPESVSDVKEEKPDNERRQKQVQYIQDNMARVGNATNAEIHEKILKPTFVSMLEEQAFWWDWSFTDPPLPLAMQQNSDAEVCGIGHPFDYDEFKVSMKNTLEYSCAISLCWLNFFASAMPSVPLSLSQIEMGIDAQVNVKIEDRALPMLLVAVEREQNPADGNLLCLTPEEILFIFFGALHRELQMGNLDDQAKRRYRQMTMSVMVKFVRVESEDDKVFAAIAERRKYMKNANSVKRSATQMIFELMQVWNRKEATEGKMTVDKLFGLYSTKLGDKEKPAANIDGDASMNVTKGLLTQARTVQLAILQMPELYSIVQKANVLAEKAPFFAMKN